MAEQGGQPIDLHGLFDTLNARHFDAMLDLPVCRWNSRLRSSAGRFIPGRRRYWQTFMPVIEIASYLREEADSERLIVDTMLHEMIHYWLWQRGRPYGHTPEFIRKMKELGVSRYNSVPRVRPYKYVYRCPVCAGGYPTRKKLTGSLACSRCCNQHAGGKYDARFKLFIANEAATLEKLNSPPSLPAVE